MSLVPFHLITPSFVGRERPKAFCVLFRSFRQKNPPGMRPWNKWKTGTAWPKKAKEGEKRERGFWVTVGDAGFLASHGMLEW
jgi:hypothetical protein